MISTVIFSYNRACQLHALLETWQRFVTGVAPVVLYHHSADEYAAGYAICRERFPWVDWREKTRPRDDVLEALTGELCMFMVDDQVWQRPWEFSHRALAPLADRRILCLSLRLSPAIDYCFSMNLRTAPPFFTAWDTWGDWITWRWKGRVGDWGYPMSIDSHVFRTAELRPCLERLRWDHPNSLESAMAASPLSAPLMACRQEHLTVNIPANLVQSVYQNRTCGGASAEELNRHYLDGQVIDVAPLVALRNRSVHTEAVYRLRPWQPPGA